MPANPGLKRNSEKQKKKRAFIVGCSSARMPDRRFDFFFFSLSHLFYLCHLRVLSPSLLFFLFRSRVLVLAAYSDGGAIAAEVRHATPRRTRAPPSEHDMMSVGGPWGQIVDSRTHGLFVFVVFSLCLNSSPTSSCTS